MITCECPCFFACDVNHFSMLLGHSAPLPSPKREEYADRSFQSILLSASDVDSWAAIGRNVGESLADWTTKALLVTESSGSKSDDLCK